MKKPDYSHIDLTVMENREKALTAIQDEFLANFRHIVKAVSAHAICRVSMRCIDIAVSQFDKWNPDATHFSSDIALYYKSYDPIQLDFEADYDVELGVGSANINSNTNTGMSWKIVHANGVVMHWNDVKLLVRSTLYKYNALVDEIEKQNTRP